MPAKACGRAIPRACREVDAECQSRRHKTCQEHKVRHEAKCHGGRKSECNASETVRQPDDGSCARQPAPKLKARNAILAARSPLRNA
jgi:hypothetical protein